MKRVQSVRKRTQGSTVAWLHSTTARLASPLRFTNPLVYLLVVAIVIVVVAWIYEGSAGVPVDAFVIGLIVLANVALGYVQESRARSAVAALARITAANSIVVRDGRAQHVRSVELVPGDLLQLAEGDGDHGDRHEHGNGIHRVLCRNGKRCALVQ